MMKTYSVYVLNAEGTIQYMRICTTEDAITAATHAIQKYRSMGEKLPHDYLVSVESDVDGFYGFKPREDGGLSLTMFIDKRFKTEATK